MTPRLELLPAMGAQANHLHRLWRSFLGTGSLPGKGEGSGATRCQRNWHRSLKPGQVPGFLFPRRMLASWITRLAHAAMAIPSSPYVFRTEP